MNHSRDLNVRILDYIPCFSHINLLIASILRPQLVLVSESFELNILSFELMIFVSSHAP